MLLQSRNVAPHSCSPKLLFKVATESRIPNKPPKTPKLLPEAASKLVRKAVQSCSRKLLQTFANSSGHWDNMQQTPSNPNLQLNGKRALDIQEKRWEEGEA